MFPAVFFNGNFIYCLGAIAISVANPTDLVKVRLQSEGKLPAGVARRYSSALSAYYTIVQQVNPLLFDESDFMNIYLKI